MSYVFPQTLGAPPPLVPDAPPPVPLAPIPPMPPVTQGSAAAGAGAPMLDPSAMLQPWVDPNADQIAQLTARINAPQAPVFTPDQVKANQSANQQQYALGLLGQMSGDADLQNVGGTVFKQALANRQPKYTDHGTYDPITGTFNYSPDYVQERDLGLLNTAQQRSASEYSNYMMNQQRIQERLQQERETRASTTQNALIMAGALGGLGAGNPQQIGSSPQGWPVYRSKMGQLFTYDTTGQPVQYQGGVAPKESNQAPTEDQGKAAGWFAQATKGAADMAQALTADPTSSTPAPLEGALQAMPGVGTVAVNEFRSPARQMFMHGASAFSEAVLRAATGAGMNEQEIKQKVEELTPQIGDSQQVVAQKLAQQPMYLNVLKNRAGRALSINNGQQSAGPQPGVPAIGANPTPAAPAAAANPADPLGLGGLFSPGTQ